MHGTLDLLEREEELSALDAALARARAGQGQVVAVEGPGGIGKTRLLAAARGAAREAGMRTLHARASELERSFTFGVVRQLFEPALFAASAEERDRWLSGAAGLTRSMFEDAGRGPRRVLLRTPARPLLAVREPRRRAPLLVCVDDAQWADEPSLSFLGFLARRLEDLPVALVLGTRPRAEQESDVPARARHRPGHAAAAAAGAEQRRRAASGCARRSTRRPAPASARACHETTGGNPFLRPRAAARGARQAAARHRRRGRGGARARPGGDLDRRAAAPEPAARRPPPRWRARSRSSARAPRPRSRPSSPSSTGRPPRRRSRRSAAPTCSPATATSSASCTRSCSRRSTTTCPVRSRTEGHGRAARLLHAHGAAPEEVASHLALTAPARRRVGGRGAARRRRAGARRSATR